MCDIQITVTAVYTFKADANKSPIEQLKFNANHIETEVSLALPDSTIITVEGRIIK